MDIENMHPFCLPFSLCHEASGSSLDGEELKSGEKSANNNNNHVERNRSRTKGALSPLDELFEQLDASSLSPPSNRSLLQDECLVESSSSSSLAMDVDSGAFHALHLDIDMAGELDGCRLNAMNGNDEEEEQDEDDVWFSATASANNNSTHDCLLFSPLDSIINSAHPIRHNHNRKSQPHKEAAFSTHSSNSSSNYHHHHHQVFHVVDAIAIKSSPTLAQLNLNASDDPTDAFWDSAAGVSSTPLATNTTTTNTSNNITNSTSIVHSAGVLNQPSLSHPDQPLVAQCQQLSSTPLQSGYLANQTTYNQHESSLSSASGAGMASMCQHLYHHHHHHHHHHASNGRSQPALEQSTCLAVAPFRKSLDLFRAACPLVAGNQTACCVHHARNNGSQAGLMHHQSTGPINSAANKMADPSRAKGETTKISAQQQRCSSPAPLVTSSSSPLSTSQANQPHEAGRMGDNNKLKENIEYLTVLLCNGSNKLEHKQTSQQQQQQQSQQQPQQQQQLQPQQHPSISSTMIKSTYSTLAQNLATEPKLLTEPKYYHHQNGHPPTNYNQRPMPAPNTQQQNMNCKTWPNNEASAQHSAGQPQQQQQQQHMIAQHDCHKRIQTDQWFKPSTVESSVSAADSTAENQLPPIRSGTFVPAPDSARQGEMKVLSSLLNSNTMCRQPSVEPTLYTTCATQPACPTWQSGNLMPALSQETHNHMGQMALQHHGVAYHTNQTHHDMKQPFQSGQEAPIPPNGRPITLTPLLSNNVILAQRQQAQTQSSSASAGVKSRMPTFVQPASPSASSTTSSSGNLEIGTSLASTVAPSKRQEPVNVASSQLKTQTGNSKSDRSGRPNSLSTDCSLSSHDEGFSSQMDQDDCITNSMREDSDDESDVDSDDESFYGDYTNSDLIGASISDNPDCKWTLSMGRTRRNGQRRYFWQYNVQSKGPKGTRIAAADGSEDPFVLPEASDPVFSNDCQIEGVKHSGKARRGDGNDLTPNPRKLLMIGLELKKLSKIINELAPVTDLPVNARNKTRKEKNKLASRACRLKKKAQHEANKIKLFGLQREHQQAVMAIYDIRKLLRESLTAPPTGTKMDAKVKSIVESCNISVAGKTSDYVNSVLEKVVSGFIDGGLQTSSA